MRDHMIQAWRLAAVDLRVRVTAPFRLILEDKQVDVIALVHDFGSSSGTIVGTLDAEGDILANLASPTDYFVSLVNPECYSTYARERFIDTLNDWQYFGHLPMPIWYTGEPWTR